MATVRTKKERFLPYAYDRFGLQFRLQSIRLDGERLFDRFDHERRLVELDGGWQTADIDLSIEINPRLLEQLLPEAERATAPIRLLLAARCPDTRLRVGHTIADGGLGPGTFPASMQLRRADLSGTMELVAYLVRAENAKVPAPGLAASQGARLASARPWEIRIDRKRASAGHYLDIRYQRFSLEESIPKCDRSNLYRLECDQETPVLWINSDHQAIAGIMEVAGSVGRHARLREVLYDQIAPSIWTQLFFRSAYHIVDAGEAVYDWEEGVLSELLKHMYPEVGDEQRLDKLRNEYADLSAVLKRLDDALQRKNDLCGHMDRLIEAID